MFWYPDSNRVMRQTSHSVPLWSTFNNEVHLYQWSQPFAKSRGCFYVQALLSFTSSRNPTLQSPSALSFSMWEAEKCLVGKKRELASLVEFLWNYTKMSWRCMYNTCPQMIYQLCKDLFCRTIVKGCWQSGVGVTFVKIPYLTFKHLESLRKLSVLQFPVCYLWTMTMACSLLLHSTTVWSNGFRFLFYSVHWR